MPFPIFLDCIIAEKCSDEKEILDKSKRKDYNDPNDFERKAARQMKVLRMRFVMMMPNTVFGHFQNR